MIKILLSVIILFGFTLAVTAQQQRSETEKADTILSKDKPTIYISFERVGERKPVHSEESDQGIWLRLHNNTKWAISFHTASLYLGPSICLIDGRNVPILRDGREISPWYEVEAVKGYKSGSTPDGEMYIMRPIEAPSVPVGTRGDVSSISWLRSGNSVTFSIPREHLAEHLAIYMTFTYEWEGEGQEPQHRVYFHNYDLPK